MTNYPRLEVLGILLMTIGGCCLLSLALDRTRFQETSKAVLLGLAAAIGLFLTVSNPNLIPIEKHLPLHERNAEQWEVHGQRGRNGESINLSKSKALTKPFSWGPGEFRPALHLLRRGPIVTKVTYLFTVPNQLRPKETEVWYPNYKDHNVTVFSLIMADDIDLRFGVPVSVPEPLYLEPQAPVSDTIKYHITGTVLDGSRQYSLNPIEGAFTVSLYE